MTTGLIEIGTPTGSDFYYQKAWSGGDGKSTENSYTMVQRTHKRGKSTSGWPSNPCIPGRTPVYRADASCVPSHGWDANDTIALNAKLAQRMKGHEFNAGIALGEGRETVNQVVDTVKSIGKSLRDIKRGNVDGALRHLTRATSGPRSDRRLKPSDSFSLTGLRTSVRNAGRQANGELHLADVSSTWLALQYGWKPMLQDIANAAEAFEVLSAPPRVNRIRVSRTSRATGNPSCTPSSSIGTGKSSHTRRYSVTMTEHVPAARSMGLLDPLAVAWELVPFSFVADWFIPIGSYFEAVSAVPPHVDIVVLLGTKTESNGTLTPASVLPGTGLCPTGYFSSWKQVDVTREPGHVVTTPQPKLKSLREAYSVPRLQNAIALAHQLFR